ncbi:MAG: hypothetical protein ACYDCX_10100 [Acidithiobacillus sp.]
MSAIPRERRSAWSLAILLGLVITVTLQIFTGIAMAAGWISLLPFHVEDGMAAALFILLEWLWLAGTRPGRGTLRHLFPMASQRWHAAGRQLQGIFLGRPIPTPALNTIVEGAFLLFATMAVLLGLLLVFTALPSRFPLLLAGHRALASLLALLWIIHLLLALYTALGRRAEARKC